MARVAQSKKRNAARNRPPLDKTCGGMVFGRLLEDSHVHEKAVQSFQRPGPLLCVFDTLGDEQFQFRELRISTGYVRFDPGYLRLVRPGRIGRQAFVGQQARVFGYDRPDAAGHFERVEQVAEVVARDGGSSAFVLGPQDGFSEREEGVEGGEVEDCFAVDWVGGCDVGAGEADRGAVVRDCEGIPFWCFRGVGGCHVQGGYGEDDVED